MVNSNSNLDYYNQRFLEIWHLTSEFIESHTYEESLNKAMVQLEDPQLFKKKLDYLSKHPDQTSFDELRFKNGQIFERYGTPHKLENKIIGRVWTFHEITERKKMEEQILFQAAHDTLTGLPNRTLLTKKLYQGIKYAKRFERNLAVLFIDLDNFKAINDNLGHEAGDILLREIAKRLASCLRETDTIFRFGGDEFVVYCLIQKSEEINNLVQKFITAY